MPLLGSVPAQDRMKALCSYSTVKAWLPILAWLPRYKLSWLQMDLIAGVTVGLTVVPQALAYAEVAGLPVEVSWGLVFSSTVCAPVCSGNLRVSLENL